MAGHPRSLAPVAAAGILMLTACGASPLPLEPDTVAVIAPQNEGMAALLVGALDISDECVTIESESGAVTPVFPSTMVAWEGDALVIDGKPHVDGAPVWLGGGFIVEGGDLEVPSGIHLPDGCPTDDVFLVAG